MQQKPGNMVKVVVPPTSRQWWFQMALNLLRGASLCTVLVLGFLCFHTQSELNRLTIGPNDVSEAQAEVLQIRSAQIGPSLSPVIGGSESKPSNGKVKVGDWGQILRELGSDIHRPLSELNTTGRAKLDILFFNRVGKTGSEMIDGLIELLADKQVNNFNLYYPGKYQSRISWMPLKQEKKLTKRLATAQTPGAYITHHVSLCNFTRHDYPMPIYINMVRDPVERAISWYYYVRQPIHPVRKHRRWPDEFDYKTMPDPSFYKMDFETCVLTGNEECTWTQDDYEFRNDQRRQTLYFCAHGDRECKRFNSLYAAQEAKRNVEKYYAVVGVQEAMDISLLVFEHYIPRYFGNATAVYNDNKYTEGLAYQNKNNFKVGVTEAVKAMIRPNFTNEIDFYQFCRQRLFRQYYAIKPLLDAKAAGESDES